MYVIFFSFRHRNNLDDDDDDDADKRQCWRKKRNIHAHKLEEEWIVAIDKDMANSFYLV